MSNPFFATEGLSLSLKMNEIFTAQDFYDFFSGLILEWYWESFYYSSSYKN